MKMFLIGVALLGASYMVRGMRDRAAVEAYDLLQQEVEEASLLPEEKSVSEWLLGTAAERTDAAYVWVERYDDLMVTLMWAGIACVVVAGSTGFLRMRERSRVEIEAGRALPEATPQRIRAVASRLVEEPTGNALALVERDEVPSAVPHE